MESPENKDEKKATGKEVYLLFSRQRAKGTHTAHTDMNRGRQETEAQTARLESKAH